MSKRWILKDDGLALKDWEELIASKEWAFVEKSLDRAILGEKTRREWLTRLSGINEATLRGIYEDFVSCEQGPYLEERFRIHSRNDFNDHFFRSFRAGDRPIDNAAFLGAFYKRFDILEDEIEARKWDPYFRSGEPLPGDDKTASALRALAHRIAKHHLKIVRKKHDFVKRGLLTDYNEFVSDAFVHLYDRSPVYQEMVTENGWFARVRAEIDAYKANGHAENSGGHASGRAATSTHETFVETASKLIEVFGDNSDLFGYFFENDPPPLKGDQNYRRVMTAVRRLLQFHFEIVEKRARLSEAEFDFWVTKSVLFFKLSSPVYCQVLLDPYYQSLRDAIREKGG